MVRHLVPAQSMVAAPSNTSRTSHRAGGCSTPSRTVSPLPCWSTGALPSTVLQQRCLGRQIIRNEGCHRVLAGGGAASAANDRADPGVDPGTLAWRKARSTDSHREALGVWRSRMQRHVRSAADDIGRQQGAHGLSGGGGPDPAVAPLSRRVPGHPQLHGSIPGCGPGRADVARQGHKGENDAASPACPSG